MPDLPTSTTLLAETMRLSMLLADQYVIERIRGDAVHEGRQAVWDTRPMLDERELPARDRDINEQALAYARYRGLILIDAAQPHIVRIVREQS